MFSTVRQLKRKFKQLSRRLRDLWRWFCAEHADQMPFSIQNDGYSPFNLLATFALAQGVALTAVAKSEGRDWLVLSVYAGVVVLTLAWIRGLLQAVRDEPVADPPVVQTVRAFDRGSIRHGRWTLSWTAVLGLIMILLGYMELLPNETPRTAFMDQTIDHSVELMTARATRPPSGTPGLARDQQLGWEKWLTWISNSGAADPTKRLIGVEKSKGFKENHKSFAGHLRFEDPKTFYMDGRVAFLVKPGAGGAPPVYR